MVYIGADKLLQLFQIKVKPKKRVILYFVHLCKTEKCEKNVWNLRTDPRHGDVARPAPANRR